MEALLVFPLKLAPGVDVPEAEAEANFCMAAGDVGRVDGGGDGGGAVISLGPNRSLILSNSVFQCGMQRVYSSGT